MYVPYISDIIRQIEEVVKIFAMEKELRLIKNRGYFPVPQLAPEECKIETIQDKEVPLTEIDEIVVEMLNAIKESEENYKREQEQARIRDEQLRSARQTSRSDINLYPTLANELWRCNNATSTSSNTINHRAATRPTGRNRLQDNNSPSPPDLRNGPTCFRCREQGHIRAECRERVFYNHCRSYNHDTKTCRKQHYNILSPANSQIATGYHPTATPPPLMGTTVATQPTGTHNNPLFNLLDNNQPRTSTIMHTSHNGTSPAMPADLVEGITQIMNQVTSNNKRDNASKKMMKNIKIFDGSNKAECITWLSQVEAAAKFTNTPFRELICQSMAPAMLHIFSDLSALASDADIKEAILTNYSDIPSTTEAATRLQNIQFSINEPLVTFNHRYKVIHKVAFRMSPSEQESKTVIVEYTKKLPANTRDKLLRKIAKKNSYVKTLDDAFKQAIDINRETSFVEAATGRYNDQNNTKIETQINELGACPVLFKGSRSLLVLA